MIQEHTNHYPMPRHFINHLGHGSSQMLSCLWGGQIGVRIGTMLFQLQLVMVISAK